MSTFSNENSSASLKLSIENLVEEIKSVTFKKEVFVYTG